MNNIQQFEKLYNEYYTRVFRYTLKKLQNVGDAEDLTQNAFLYCYRHFNEYDKTRASFGTWLFLVVNSRIKNYYRDRKDTIYLNEYLYDIPQEESFLTAIDLEEMRSQIAEAVNCCTPIQKKIVLLKYFENYKAKEIGKMLGLTEGNVRTILSRALSTMEKYISNMKR